MKKLYDKPLTNAAKAKRAYDKKINSGLKPVRVYVCEPHKENAQRIRDLAKEINA